MVNRVLEECRKPPLAHVRRNDDWTFAIHELEDHLRVAAHLGIEGFSND